MIIECTKDNPWDGVKLENGVRISHPDAIEIAEDYGSLGSGGSHIEYECPHCKHKFLVQLPD